MPTHNLARPGAELLLRRVRRDHRLAHAHQTITETVGSHALGGHPGTFEQQIQFVGQHVRLAEPRVLREAKKNRNRVERTLTRNEKRVERNLKSARRDIERDTTGFRKNIEANVDLVTAQVENAVQTGITAGTKLAAVATDRVASAA